MSRAFILVLDSLGIGSSADADRYGDAGADTLGHIAGQCAARGGPLAIPNLLRLGLGMAALEEFDRRLPAFEARLRPGDLVLMTADHGCDPTWMGTDHTREHVPVLFFGPGVRTGSLGRRDGFCDMGQTIAAHPRLGALEHGVACEVT
jgi:phosphopentomutase